MKSAQGQPGQPEVGQRRTRSWPVRAVSLLLLFQAAGYVALSTYLLLPFDWIQGLEQSPDLLSPAQVQALSVSVVLIPAVLPALVAAVGFLFLFRAGWLLAMLMQAGTLAGCLVLYFSLKPVAIYPVMLFSVLMVFYLNSSDVRVAFHGRANPQTGAGHHDD